MRKWGSWRKGPVAQALAERLAPSLVTLYQSEEAALRGDVSLIAFEGDVVEHVCGTCGGEGLLLDHLLCPECHGTRRVVENDEVWSLSHRNLITTAGKALSLNRLYQALAVMNGLTHTGVGTSNTAAAVGDTGLTGATWKVFDATPVLASTTVTSVTTYGTAEANINIQECAVANASAGTMINRLAPIGPFNKTTAVSLALTLALTQT